jgi:hypothetical protein
VDELPEWERGTPAVLCVSGPHPIPISTAVRVAGDRVRFALGREREALRRLREDERAALLVMGKGLAFTAHGTARVIAEGLEVADTVVAIELRVAHLQDHLADGRTDMVDGARWRWTDDALAESEPKIWAELERLGPGD